MYINNIKIRVPFNALLVFSPKIEIDGILTSGNLQIALTKESVKFKANSIKLNELPLLSLLGIKEGIININGKFSPVANKVFFVLKGKQIVKAPVYLWRDNNDIFNVILNSKAYLPSFLLSGDIIKGDINLVISNLEADFIKIKGICSGYIGKVNCRGEYLDYNPNANLLSNKLKPYFIKREGSFNISIANKGIRFLNAIN